MLTKAQIKANRKNARKSTGPKTYKGKEKSSRNATKHGFFACQDVIKSESQLEFDMLSSEMLDELNPIGPMEHILADRIVSLTWRLKRVARMHTETIDFLLEQDVGRSEFLRGLTDNPKEQDPELALGRVTDRDFSYNRTLDRLILCERRIENSLYKTIKELKQLQNASCHSREGGNPRTPQDAQRTTQQAKRETSPEVRMPHYPPDENIQNKPNLYSTSNDLRTTQDAKRTTRKNEPNLPSRQPSTKPHLEHLRI
jgi:hypothetical protein